MNNLELKHLAPYLPYGLKALFDYGGDELILSEIKMLSKSDAWDSDGEDFSFSEIKPILRPLSDLTKEIEHKGEKFIPLVELAKIAYTKGSNTHGIRDNYVYIGHGYSFHFDKSEVSFWSAKGFNGKTWSYNCHVPNQLDLFNKLFEWHFDVFGLIEKGLAIDINTIEK